MCARTVRTIGEVRRAVGDDVDILLDMGFAVPLEDAIYLGRALAEHRVYFLEEPLSPDDIAGFARLTAVSPTPIATGEKEIDTIPVYRPDGSGRPAHHPARYRPRRRHLRERCASPPMPRRAMCGSSRIAGRPTSWSRPRCTCIAVLRDCPYLEYNVTDNPLRTDLLQRRLQPTDGMIDVPTGPGLGIELDEAVVARYRVDG